MHKLTFLLKKKLFSQTLFCTFLLVLSPPMIGAKIIIDRVLFKINESSFTQREMEIYLLVQGVQSANRELIATEKSWKTVLLTYKDAMLIYEESRKLHFTIDQKNINQQVQNIKDLIQKDPSNSEISNRLGIEDKDIELALSVNVRIEKGKSSLKEGPNDSLGVPPAKRIPALERKNFVRFYDNAETYQLIQPKAIPLSSFVKDP